MESLSVEPNVPSLSGSSGVKHVFSPRALVDRAIKILTHSDLGLVLLVFILGFIVRAQLMRYELFFEFDSYWHARMVSYILQGLPAVTVDPLAYYQNVAAATLPNPSYLFWYVSAAIYKLFSLNAPYNLELWVLFVKIIPALYGAIICVAMYFLGKELFKGHAHEKAAGLFAGLFAAIVPSFVYRTMGGFFEDDSFGFIWMVLGFIFLVRATQKPSFTKSKIVDALLSGIFFGTMAFAWSGFNQLVPILLGIGFMQFWNILIHEPSESKPYAGLWMISFATFSLFATLSTGTGWLSQFGTIVGNLLFKTEFFWYHTLAVIFVLFFICGIAWKIRHGSNLHHQKFLGWIYSLIILVLILSPLLVFMFHISLRTGDVLGQTVGEESEGSNYFGNKYSFMIIFAMIGLPACGYLLLKRARQYSFLILPIIWLVVTFFMAWGKLKFTYYWGLPLALMSGIVCVLALKWVLSHSTRTQKIVAVLIGFLVVGGIAAGTIFVTQNVPNIESSAGWKSALFWANENLPKNAKFFNWWDEGHWISFLSNRGVLIDNRNADTKATSDVAKFILSTDENEAVALIEKYGSTHLIFGDDLLSKEASMGYYAYNITNGSDPRIQGIFGTMLSCSPQTQSVTREQTYQCGSNTFTVAEFTALPTKWQSTPNNNQGGVAYFVYRDPRNTKLYAFTGPANQTMLVRLWMNDPVLKGFTEIYENTGGVRIYEFHSGAI